MFDLEYDIFDEKRKLKKENYYNSQPRKTKALYYPYVMSTHNRLAPFIFVTFMNITRRTDECKKNS